MKRSIILLLVLAQCWQSCFAQSVGTSEGVFNVSDLGGAGYSIPIKVPDGINGMQPSLSLTYSSQSGNGPLGMGWSIAGLSVITRVGTTIYQDNKVEGVSLTGKDKFALDGSRLIVTGGTYGAPNSKYSTEVESFKTITANNNLGTGPQSFTVVDQNGWTYEYGNTTDSRQIPVGKTKAVAWYLNKVTDLNGNYMTYTYLNSNGEVILSSIKYNCNQNTGLEYQTYVAFSVTPGANPNKIYTAGGSIQSTLKITKITVGQKAGSTWKYYRSYTPEYTDEFYTHLVKITEKGAEELETLKPTEFTYGFKGSPYSGMAVPNVQFDNNNNFASGDYNGDGYTDLIKFSTENQGAYSLLINNKNNGFTPVWNSTFENGFANAKGKDLTKEGERNGGFGMEYIWDILLAGRFQRRR